MGIKVGLYESRLGVNRVLGPRVGTLYINRFK